MIRRNGNPRTNQKRQKPQMDWCSEVLKVGLMISADAAHITVTHRSLKTMRAWLEITVLARLRSIHCRRCAAAGDAERPAASEERKLPSTWLKPTWRPEELIQPAPRPRLWKSSERTEANLALNVGVHTCLPASVARVVHHVPCFAIISLGDYVTPL